MHNQFLRAGLLALCVGLLSACGSTADRNSSGTVGALAKTGNDKSVGVGRVFLPNPVQSTGDQSLSDAKDSDAAVPYQAYFGVTLSNLDGSGYLSGDYANVISETGDPAFSPSNTFQFSRSDDRFEQVMAYFWVTEAQKYLQSLGFGSELPAVNRESQDVRINQWGQDNSYSWDKHDVIRLGKGGVDDAEDGEVIVHEYGHAVHDAQVGSFGTSIEAGSIGEGFGDYLAVTVGLAVAAKNGAPLKADAACVADWDAVSYTSSVPHCLRRIDTNRTYDNRTGRVHADGMIWSRALWDIREALGATVADRIIINAQFDFAPDTSMSAAAKATIAAAEKMYGAREVKVVSQAFADRKIPLD
jgi:hypothetical protein